MSENDNTREKSEAKKSIVDDNIENKNKNKKNDVICKRCGASFESKNAMFRHLRNKATTCLTIEEQDEFNKIIVNNDRNWEKVVILYGYIVKIPEKVDLTIHSCDGGDSASHYITKAMNDIIYDKDDEDIAVPPESNNNGEKSKVNRSYGIVSRGNGNLLKQDSQTGALTEVMTARLPPLFYETQEERKEVTRIWVDRVNRRLSKIMSQTASITNNNNNDNNKPCNICVFGRLPIPKKFSAEMDVTHIRMDYLIPADFLYSGNDDRTSDLNAKQEKDSLSSIDSRADFFNVFCDFQPDKKITHRKKSTPLRSQTRAIGGTHKHMYRLKKLMQSFTCQVEELDILNSTAVMEKEFNEKARAFQKSKKRRNNNIKGENNNDQQSPLHTKKKLTKSVHTNNNNNFHKNNDNQSKNSSDSIPPKHDDKQAKPKTTTKNVLRRRRYHNFSPKAMAHEFLTYRRVDRFYHRSTLRFDKENALNSELKNDKKLHRPFFILSVTGDRFLNGQIRSMIGLYIAIVRGFISEDIIQCIFDEEYQNLVLAPMVPATGLYAAEVQYMFWEGKAKTILGPRPSDRYELGWNDDDVIATVNDFEKRMHASIAEAWFQEGFVDDDNERDCEFKRLKAEKSWVEDYLKPWAVRTNIELENYRKWKAAKIEVANAGGSKTVAESLLPSISSVDPKVPFLFKKVLDLLREADSSELWPATTPKRQLVMISTAEDENDTSLSVAHMKAQSNTDTRTSAYAFKEGQGGASGSFSIGAMPGNQCEQPKGNILFPELMKAAFELEIALCPDREPSSTIAVNRNAQFRPHVDNGAGAGQSTSLIVGLGTYVGGELMVEGIKHDIRYKHIEFNGWTQRHWTLPFVGERYSLVWFTPKGCEGIHGIDLNN